MVLGLCGIYLPGRRVLLSALPKLTLWVSGGESVLVFCHPIFLFLSLPLCLAAASPQSQSAVPLLVAVSRNSFLEFSSSPEKSLLRS